MPTIKTKKQYNKVPISETILENIKIKREKENLEKKETKQAIDLVKNEIFEQTKSTLPDLLRNKTEAIIKEIETIAQEKQDSIVYEETKYGQKLDRIDYGLVEARIAPLIANRSVNFYVNSMYTADELYIIYNEFVRMISEINKSIKYLPTKKKFCSFAGITTSTYSNYLQDFDNDKRNVMQMIDDYITDVNLSSAQQGEVREITTMFRSKAEHGMIEAQAPIVIEHKRELNVTEIKERLEKYKGKVFEAEYTEINKED